MPGFGDIKFKHSNDPEDFFDIDDKYILKIKAINRMINGSTIGKDGCWRRRGKTTNGYSMLWFNGRHLYGHRASWELYRSKIPKGMWVCHKCDVRNCVNPDHLFIGTRKDNMQDCAKKGRVFNQRLSQDQVIKIRNLIEQGKSLKCIAKEYGVDPKAIANIKNNITYEWVK